MSDRRQDRSKLMNSNLEAFLQERKHAKSESLQNFFHRSPNSSGLLAQLRINHQQRVSQRAELRYFSGKQCKKSELLYDVHFPDEKFCQIHWKTVDNLPISSQEQSILTLFETVQVARLACSVNINEQNEEVINIIIRKDLGEIAEITQQTILITPEEKCGTHSVEILEAPVPILKPRSEALSLVSSCDSGYESEEWEFVDDEADEDDNQDDVWEYFIDVSSIEVPKKELQNANCKTYINWKTTAQEESVSRTLRNWIKIIKDPNSEILVCLEEEFKASNCFEDASNEKSLKPSISKYVGKKDKNGKYHGEGEIRYSNGSILWGTFKHGVMEGRAVMEHLNGEKYEGEFVKDKFEGWVNETYERTGWRQTFYRHGVQVGYYRDISPCGRIVEFGVIGSVIWRLCEGESLTIAKKNIDGKFHDANSVYLYPGFEMGLSVSFENGRMTKGREATPAYIKQDKFGLPCVHMNIARNSRLLEFESPGTHIPAKNCLVRDLWDMFHVYVAPSRVEFAGEGLYARRDIKKDSLVCLFSGSRKRHFRHADYIFSDYCIKLDESCSIDIPDFYIPVTHYSATLAHKACHSFSPNSRFDMLYHPRFGKIMAIFAKEDISKDAEIFVSYNYSVPSSPGWYQQAWFTYLSRDRGWSKEDITTSGLNASTNANIFARIDDRTQKMKENKQVN